MILDKSKIKQIFFQNVDLIQLVDEEMQKQILQVAIEEDIAILEGVWSKISEKLQREYLAEILAIDEYDDSFFISSLWCATKKQVQEDNPEIFIEILRQIHKDDDYMETVMENTSENLIGNTIDLLLQLDDLQSLPISPFIAERIISTTCNIPIVLTIKDASELSVGQLEQLEAVLKIETIKIGNDKYKIEMYKACRRKIDEKIEGLDLQANLGNPNREKYIFGQIIKRLANDICYDYELEKKEKNGEAKSDESENARNLVGGLLNGSCVCVGNAEIVRNVLVCCGIECINIGGDEHMWNQVKLDGEWFNIDFTWDRKRIVKMEPPQYLLKSDEDFKGHNVTFYEKKKCSRTISENELIGYIYEQQFQITPQHIANVTRTFCSRQPGVLQSGISKLRDSFTNSKGDTMEK